MSFPTTFQCDSMMVATYLSKRQTAVPIPDVVCVNIIIIWLIKFAINLYIQRM